MDSILQIAVLCVIGALLALVLKRTVPEFGTLVTLGAAVIVLCFLAKELKGIVVLLQTLAEKSGMGQTLFFPLYKTTAISVVVHVGGGLCRDAGESALASVIEIAGTVCALLVAVPLLERVLTVFMELMM